MGMINDAMKAAGGLGGGGGAGMAAGAKSPFLQKVFQQGQGQLGGAVGHSMVKPTELSQPDTALTKDASLASDEGLDSATPLTREDVLSKRRAVRRPLSNVRPFTRR